jgi:hypothetical protein
MELLHNAVLDSTVTRHGVDWMFKARLLLRITDDEPESAKAVIHTPAGGRAAKAEYDSLTEAERTQLGDEVGMAWACLVKTAIGKLWHAADVLGIDTADLDPDHVGLVAATLLSAKHV